MAITAKKKLSLLPAFGAVAACIAFAGCNHGWRPMFWNMRHNQDVDVIQTEGSETVDSDNDKEKKSLIRGFYKNNRLGGGLSDEARDIERSFNIDK